MKNINWIHVLLFLGVIIFTKPLFCSEYQEVDRLLLQLTNSEEDTIKVILLLRLSNSTNWNDIKASEEYAKQALQLSQELNYQTGLGYSKFQLAKIYSYSEFNFAESLIIQCFDHAKMTNDSILMARAYNVFGSLKKNTNQPYKALTYYNKSLGIYLRHSREENAAGIYNNLALVYKDLPDNSLSIYYYQKAIEINKRTRNYSWLAINYVNLGHDNIKDGMLKEGYNNTQLSLKLADEHNFKYLYAEIYNNLSYYYLKIKKYRESIKYASKALVISKDHANRLAELDALELMNEAYTKMADFKNAYHYLEQINSVEDSINKYNKLKELDFLEMKYKYEGEVNQQKLEKVLIENKYYRHRLIFLISTLIAGLLIFVFLLLFIAQRNRIRQKSLEQKTILLEKEKLTKDLEFKNKELATNVIYSIQKNKVLSTLTEELVEIEKTAVKEETRKAIQKIAHKIHKSIDANAWEEFEIRFQQVHIEFYETLSAKHADLTPNEKRLCAFLKLDMSSKEISWITGQSIPALEMARIRLRKKLGISNKDINLITFLSRY